MGSLLFGCAILAIYYVFYWSIKNDKAESIADQTGFIRMKPPKSDQVTEATNSRIDSRNRPVMRQRGSRARANGRQRPSK